MEKFIMEKNNNKNYCIKVYSRIALGMMHWRLNDAGAFSKVNNQLK